MKNGSKKRITGRARRHRWVRFIDSAFIKFMVGVHRPEVHGQINRPRIEQACHTKSWSSLPRPPEDPQALHQGRIIILLLQRKANNAQYERLNTTNDCWPSFVVQRSHDSSKTWFWKNIWRSFFSPMVYDASSFKTGRPRLGQSSCTSYSSLRTSANLCLTVKWHCVYVLGDHTHVLKEAKGL